MRVLPRDVGVKDVPEWVWRYATAFRRVLPTFLGIGAQKAGTTALMHYLRQHPQAAWGKGRELHYFDRNYHRGERWYRARFPLARQVAKNMAVGEGSPEYLLHPHAARRISALLPQVKLVVLLRDPAQRAISHYFMEVKRGREPLGIEEAMKSEEERIGPERERLEADPHHDDKLFQRRAYKAKGRYAEQLRRYYQYFDRSQIFVMESGRFNNDTRNALNEICAFLGIDPAPETIDLAKHNVTKVEKTVPPEVEEYLNDYFQPHNEELYELLGVDFGW
ncbi:MAG: sulfotransferase family protein [Spirochaetaceae bacterium]